VLNLSIRAFYSGKGPSSGFTRRRPSFPNFPQRIGRFASAIRHLKTNHVGVHVSVSITDRHFFIQNYPWYHKWTLSNMICHLTVMHVLESAIYLHTCSQSGLPIASNCHSGACTSLPEMRYAVENFGNFAITCARCKSSGNRWTAVANPGNLGDHVTNLCQMCVAIARCSLADSQDICRTIV
jgi:hypothetical protein